MIKQNRRRKQMRRLGRFGSRDRWGWHFPLSLEADNEQCDANIWHQSSSRNLHYFYAAIKKQIKHPADIREIAYGRLHSADEKSHTYNYDRRRTLSATVSYTREEPYTRRKKNRVSGLAFSFAFFSR